MSLEAVIFDMDGVISDTQTLHSEAQSKVLEKHGTKLSPQKITRKYASKPSRMLFKQESNIDPEKAYNEKQDVLQEIVEKNGIEPIEGSIDLIKELSGQYKLGIASSSRPEFIRKVLDNLNIEGYFKTVKSVKGVDRGKPSPDIFLETAKDLKVLPKDCIVIEDSSNGMNGAINAGMSCLGLVEQPGKYPADKTVRSLKKVDAGFLEKIHSK